MDAHSLAELQATLRQMATRSAASDGQGDGVWPENWPTVKAFLAVTTQWRVVSIGGGGFAPTMPRVLGFDYSGVRAGLDAGGFAVTPEIWRGLQIMEEAATAALNEVS